MAVIENDDERTKFDPKPWGAQQRLLPRRGFKAVCSVIARLPGIAPRPAIAGHAPLPGLPPERQDRRVARVGPPPIPAAALRKKPPPIPLAAFVREEPADPAPASPLLMLPRAPGSPLARYALPLTGALVLLVLVARYLIQS